MNNTRKTVIISILVITLFSIGIFLTKNNIFAGTLNNALSPAPTFYTLTDIYNRLTTNATATAEDHNLGPSASPDSTFYTLTQIYDAIPTIDASKVVYGTTYLGVAGTATTTVSTLCYDNTYYYNSLSSCSENYACDSVFNGTYTADGLVCNNSCVVNGSVADDGVCCHDDNCNSIDCTNNTCAAIVCGNSIIQPGETCDSNSSGTCTSGEYYGSYPCLENCSGYSGTCGDPLYTDEAQTQPANPPTDLAISYDEVGQVVTLTWEDRGYDYEVYQTDKPTLDISTWTLVSTDADSETAGFQINVTAENGFFTVVADDDTENIVKLGYFAYNLLTGYNHISLALDYGIDTTTELGQVLDLEAGDEICIFRSIDWDDWDCSESIDGINWEPNYTGLGYTAIRLDINDPKTVYLAGEVPDSEVNFDINGSTTYGRGYNFIYLPLSKYDAGLDTAAKIGDDMNNNLSSIMIWNNVYQNWLTASYLSGLNFWINSFDVNSEQPLMIRATQSFTWPQ
jgi:hypothetical protein